MDNELTRKLQLLETLLDDLARRMVRMETRICKLLLHMGLDAEGHKRND